MKSLVKAIITCSVVTGISWCQDQFTPTGLVPDFSAQLALGFNYDFLKSPLRVSFDYPKGYFSINVPLSYSPPKTITGNLTDLLAEQFEEGEAFDPQASAKQSANTTIKVDVPMMGGVATFSNIQMMYFRYSNTLGLSNLKVSTEEGSDIGIFMRGIVSVPLDLQVGWETMTFGYAYEVNDKLKLAFNLHRHVFTFDLKGKIDIDILGNFGITVSDESIGDYTMNGTIGYGLNNVIDGHYEAEEWTPTFAVQYWRLALISRFGMNSKPRGFLKARYSLPFFIDPETFAIDKELQDQDLMQTYLTDNMDKMLNNETNEVEYSTTKNMKWNMPQAHTIMFDIIPEKLSLSYTKLFGDIEMELVDPTSDKLAQQDTSNYPDTLDFRFRAKVDHMIFLHGSFYNSFFNLGIYSMDFGFRDNDDLLQNIKALENLKFGDGIITPILNLGALVGSKLQLLVELDVLPFTAFKTGIVYYF